MTSRSGTEWPTKWAEASRQAGTRAKCARGPWLGLHRQPGPVQARAIVSPARARQCRAYRKRHCGAPGSVNHRDSTVVPQQVPLRRWLPAEEQECGADGRRSAMAAQCRASPGIRRRCTTAGEAPPPARAVGTAGLTCAAAADRSPCPGARHGEKPVPPGPPAADAAAASSPACRLVGDASDEAWPLAQPAREVRARSSGQGTCTGRQIS